MNHGSHTSLLNWKLAQNGGSSSMELPRKSFHQIGLFSMLKAPRITPNPKWARTHHWHCGMVMLIFDQLWSCKARECWFLVLTDHSINENPWIRRKICPTGAEWPWHKGTLLEDHLIASTDMKPVRNPNSWWENDKLVYHGKFMVYGFLYIFP